MKYGVGVGIMATASTLVITTFIKCSLYHLYMFIRSFIWFLYNYIAKKYIFWLFQGKKYTKTRDSDFSRKSHIYFSFSFITFLFIVQSYWNFAHKLWTSIARSYSRIFVIYAIGIFLGQTKFEKWIFKEK